MEKPSKKLVFVTPEGRVDVWCVAGDDFAYLEQVKEISAVYSHTHRAFTDMQAELLALKDGTGGNADDFIKRHGAWLANLSRTGFAIEYTQFVNG